MSRRSLPAVESQPASSAIREVSAAVTAAHLFIYRSRELGEEADAMGGPDRALQYLAYRAAALGAVPWQVVLAVFYNFSPRAVQHMAGAWEVAPPERWQAARFAAAGRAMRRVGVPLGNEQIAEARSLIDPVVAAADYAGRPMAAANASVPLPDDPLVALWQQLTVVREWRGDAHVTVLQANGVGPCACQVLSTGTDEERRRLVQRTRLWNDEEWAEATDQLAGRGWLEPGGTLTDEGAAVREGIEVATDELCEPLWAPIGDEGTTRLTELIAPIGEAFVAAGVR
jgi:hypothetical protein